MYLFAVAPMFSSRGNAEILPRKEAWRSWWETHIDELTARFRIYKWDRFGLAPGAQGEIGGPEPLVLRFPDAENALIQKGLAVRACLLMALHSADQVAVDGRNDAAFILIDGSGAFDFSNIFTVLDTLQHADVVFGLRPTENFGMAPWRKSVEDFEHFVLLEHTKGAHSNGWSSTNLFPDGQAGCWGFWLSAMRELPLSAPDYEIEFDVLSSSLRANLNIKFTPALRMMERGASDFRNDPNDSAVARCIAKMHFIRHKLKLGPNDILKAVESFEQIHAPKTQQLPTNYLKGLRAAFRSGFAATG